MAAISQAHGALVAALAKIEEKYNKRTEEIEARYQSDVAWIELDLLMREGRDRDKMKRYVGGGGVGEV